MSDIIERAEAAIEGKWFGHLTATRLMTELVAELKAARTEAERWRAKAEEYRFDNRGDW